MRGNLPHPDASIRPATGHLVPINPLHARRSSSVGISDLDGPQRLSDRPNEDVRVKRGRSAESRVGREPERGDSASVGGPAVGDLDLQQAVAMNCSRWLR
jgi:hypothetical protein